MMAATYFPLDGDVPGWMHVRRRILHFRRQARIHRHSGHRHRNRRTVRPLRRYLAAVAPQGHKMMEGPMDACFVRTTATWLAAIFVSSLFVTAATSAVSIL